MYKIHREMEAYKKDENIHEKRSVYTRFLECVNQGKKTGISMCCKIQRVHIGGFKILISYKDTRLFGIIFLCLNFPMIPLIIEQDIMSKEFFSNLH